MIPNTRARSAFKPGSVRLAALVLTALTLCAALISRPAQAAEWMQPYLEQVQEWGVMRGDANGNLHEDRSITRAEFVTLVNRAFGYTDVGPNPFSDVNDNDWYAEDIRIAHQAGYFQGTSPNTASPLNLVTREQAAVLLGRCLRFQGVSGAANSTFTDMRDIGGWSRGLVQEAADLGIIQGYADGSFKPDLPITRGQMACFLVRALGTLIQEPGEQTSGGVYGNLTITTPGVKLKDTTVTGNLYLTGGVGLGDVELENVNVLGKIVLTGGGEAEGGQHSVILRNVTAASLEVDSLTDQFLSIMAEGLTNIGTATVRNSAYVEDRTDDGLGFQVLRLDGGEDSQFQLAGNIKQVVNLTPGSTLQVAQGVADTVTFDEKALDASLIIDNIASIRELNLDTATKVTGEGGISHLNVNAPGSNVSMLPDTIYVRPGITGNINKVDMDNKTANESSEDPRLLAGYPIARNVAPTSADAVFRTNKAGTIHWGLTALMDGSLGEEELMNPGSYAKIIRSGTLNATAANTDFTARLTGLTKDGSYYVSAMLVDARGRRSPVKVAAFTTPDDTAPNFATGYPQAPILTTDADGEQVAQIMVMPTKDCQLYYVLLPKGSTAPTAADFRSAALPGNLGFGVVTVRKNTPFLISRINTSHLQEKTDYDLYLWLNDADNGKSSAVRKVTVTTKDITPPTITDLSVKTFNATTVTIRFILDEPGTLSWAAVTEGASIRVNKENPTQADQIKIENIPADGKTVVRRGGPVRAAVGGNEYTFTVSGLQAETTYDLYYMAKDTAGNYCVYNKSIAFPYPIRTQDGNPPSAEPWISRPDPDNDTPTLRYALLNSDVGIQFSEVVQGYDPNSLTGDDPIDFQALYDDVVRASGEEKERAKNTLASALRSHITLYPGTPSGNNEPSQNPIPEITASTDPAELENLPAWIDFREAQVVREGGKTRIVFPNGTGIQMQSGSRYFFRVEAVQDTADSPNQTSALNVAAFATVSARVDIVEHEDGDTDPSSGRDITIFRLEPNDATAYSPEATRWDLILWAHSNIEYDLLVRRPGGDWVTLGRTSNRLVDGKRAYRSLFGTFGSVIMANSELSDMFGIEPGHTGLPYLHGLSADLEFGILPTADGQTENVTMEAEIYVGTNTQLRNISISMQGTDERFSALQTPLERVSNPKAYQFIVPSNLSPVVSINPRGIKILSESEAEITVSLSLPGNVYCVAIPVTSGSGTNYALPVQEKHYPKVNAADTQYANLDAMPTSLISGEDEMWLNDTGHPKIEDIIDESFTWPDGVKYHKEVFRQRGSAIVPLHDLEPDRTYILYLVSEDTLGNPASRTLCYKFTTNPAKPPKIALSSQRNAINIRVMPTANIRYVMVESDALNGTYFNEPFSNANSQWVDPAKGPLPPSYNGTTVRDAMHTLVDGDGDYFNSIFDLYASDSIKNLCQGAIINPSTSGSLPLTSVGLQDRYTENTPPMDETGFFSLDELDDDVAYTLFTVAWTDSSKIYGFRAEYDYSETSAETLSAFCTYDQEHRKLYVTFNVEPWYWVSVTERYQIDNCQTGITHTNEDSNYISSDGFVRLERLMTTTGGFGFADPASNHGHGFLTLEFSILSPTSAATITFRNLCNSAGATVSYNGNTRSPLNIELQNHGTTAEPVWQAHWSRAFGGDLDR